MTVESNTAMIPEETNNGGRVSSAQNTCGKAGSAHV